MLSKIQANLTSQKQFRAKTIHAPLQYLSKSHSESVSFGKRTPEFHTKEFKNLYKRSNDLLTILEQKYSLAEKLEKNGIEIGTVVKKFTPRIKMELPNGNITELYRHPITKCPAIEVVDAAHSAPAVRYDVNQLGSVIKQEMAPLKPYAKMKNEEESLALQTFFQQILNKFGM